jgi:hypothetical protein
MRQPNAIDFWRGYALVSIFVNHIPGNFFERFQYRNLTLSDSAELFVFLAGWAMRLSIENPRRPMSNSAVIYKLWGRAFTIYVAQTFITEIAIFILAASSVLLDAPFLLDWHNVGAVFHQPVEAHIGLVLLTYQLGYFNILPLYVVLMVVAPVIALLYRNIPALVLPLSVGLYVLTLALGWNIPSWPIEGTWFFSPSAWQLIYVLGFLAAGRTTDLGAFARRHLRALRIAAVPIVVVGMVIASTRFYPDWIALPRLNLFFIVYDKTFTSPDRLFSLLALVVLGGGIFHYIHRWLPGLTGFLSLFGRNSLHVFCAGSLLSLCGQIVRFIYGGSIVTDAILFIVGIAVMALTAWVLEWRTRSKAEVVKVPALPAPAASPSQASSSQASAS